MGFFVIYGLCFLITFLSCAVALFLPNGEYFSCYVQRIHLSSAVRPHKAVITHYARRIKMERLKNIHIENYPFSTQEIPVLALIKLYLSQTNEPIKAIDTALNSRAGLEFLIEKAKASVFRY